MPLSFMFDHRLQVSRTRRYRGFLLLSLIWLLPSLACGSFAPRPTPTPTARPTETAVAAVVATPSRVPVTPVLVPTFTPAPTPTFTPTPIPGTALVVGQPARVSAPNGLNMREQPNTNATLIVRLGTGIRVTVVEGPVVADGFTWWKIDDGQGSVGWAADGDGETIWIDYRLGEPQPIDREPRVGDLVQVTTQTGQFLTIRVQPGTNATVVARVPAGRRYTIIGGPQSVSGFTWYQIRAQGGGQEGWAASGDGTTRWLSPLE